ncbi:triple tyrosine motif-containing protein [Sphingomonas sp. DG1-23]|uniref:sensor histidine kinase n=1 Tax=Sphingomonas sp. DG1-23 TaxID=3068316 RepID=UPI00273D1371|nr:sensor histidine kinase [Sphingomonas sp. DG1-23]MDP5277469.1 triple tyrosine motif-containing protein [Sphingomonas sp. DG1-23]
MQLKWTIFVAAALLLLLPCVDAAADPSDAPARRLSHYTHQRWSAESDAPRPVFALAQDRRGYLWVASAAGLFRFDGIRFEAISMGVDLIEHGAPSALLVRRNGEIWTNFERSGRFAVYRDGQLRFLRAPPAPARVMSMHEAEDGTIWVATERIGVPLLRFRHGKWTSFGIDAGAPLDNPFSMAVTPDGTVWFSFTASVARLARDGGRFEFVLRRRGMLGRLSLDPQQRVWLTERRGTYPLTGPRGQGKPPLLRHAYATDKGQIRGWPTFDREGNLWIATYYHGLQRIPRPDPRGAPSTAEGASAVEHFTARDGLSSNAMAQILQDAEGNVWAATENGVDRFWPATLRLEPELTEPGAFGDLLLQGTDGAVYIGQAHTVYRVRPGGRPEAIFRTKAAPRTLCEAPDGGLWIALDQTREVVIWRAGRVDPLGRPAPLTDTIYDCAFDARGGFWLTAALGGMARYRAGRWQRMFDSPGSGFLPKSMVTDEQGRIVLQWNDHVLSRLEGEVRRSVPLPLDGYGPAEVALYPIAPATLFAGGRFGLARLRDDRFQSISARRVPLLSGVNGMVRTSEGDTWLTAPSGVLRIASTALDRAFADPGAALPIQVFGAVDGLRSRPHSHSRRAIVRGGDGRLWIATQTGTLWLDPTDVTRSRTPPNVAVGALVTRKRVYRDPAALTLPAGTSNIQIDFAVLSFSNPRATQVRYRIEGQDADWVEAGTRRQAFYTNLKPGSYRFRLIAANDNGIWNEQGATVDFVIPPTFVQSGWFAALCVAFVLLLLAAAYRLRVAQVANRIRTRLEERLGERERIARELHDTLLQSVQGLVLRFQSVANKMPPEGASRTQLEAALQRADEVLAEGRDRVQDLRASSGSGDLAELIKDRAIDAGFDPQIPIRIIVEGRQRTVHPLVAAELGRIAGEALFNAARHARASSVDITIRFEARQLAVEVRDDGVGITGEVLDKGHKPGHFGLIGMRERAERIGGSFSVDSRPGMGCAVTMALPARLAFADHAPRGRLFARLWRRWKESGHG